MHRSEVSPCYRFLYKDDETKTQNLYAHLVKNGLESDEAVSPTGQATH